MYAYRWSFKVKVGRVAEVVELFESLSFQPDNAEYRIYRPDHSPWLVVTEVVVESQEAYDEYMAGLLAPSEAARFREKLNPLIDEIVSRERWTVTRVF